MHETTTSSFAAALLTALAAVSPAQPPTRVPVDAGTVVFDAPTGRVSVASRGRTALAMLAEIGHACGVVITADRFDDRPVEVEAVSRPLTEVVERILPPGVRFRIEPLRGDVRLDLERPGLGDKSGVLVDPAPRLVGTPLDGTQPRIAPEQLDTGPWPRPRMAPPEQIVAGELAEPIQDGVDAADRGHHYRALVQFRDGEAVAVVRVLRLPGALPPATSRNGPIVFGAYQEGVLRAVGSMDDPAVVRPVCDRLPADPRRAAPRLRLADSLAMISLPEAAIGNHALAVELRLWRVAPAGDDAGGVTVESLPRLVAAGRPITAGDPIRFHPDHIEHR